MKVQLDICNSGLRDSDNDPSLAEQVAIKLAAMGGDGNVDGANNFGFFGGSSAPGSSVTFGIYAAQNGVAWNNLGPGTVVIPDYNHPGAFVNYHMVNANPSAPQSGH